MYYLRIFNCFLFLTFVVLCPFFSRHAIAIEGEYGIEIISSGETTSFRTVHSKIKSTISETRSHRRDYESQISYDRRISRAFSSLEKLTKIKYRIITSPDRVYLNWENSIITIVESFPATIHRKRGGANDANRIEIKFAAPEGKSRVLKKFGNNIQLEIIFRFSRDSSVVIEGIKVELFGDELYLEEN